MLIYSKIKYETLCAFYDAIEQGLDYPAAAEQVLRKQDGGEGLERVIASFTIAKKLLPETDVLPPRLLAEVRWALATFQAIPEAELTAQIPQALYLTDLSKDYQHITDWLERHDGLDH